MPLTITIADNRGTPSVGAVATVGQTGGAAVQIYTSPADVAWPNGDWTLTGSRTGDGTVALSLQSRNYFAFAQTNAERSLPIRFAVTDGQLSVATRCRRAIVDVLKQLNLAEIGDRVVEQVYTDETENRFPGVFVTVLDVTESEEQGLNELDYIVYPVLVSVYDAQIVTDHRHLPKYELWRQKIARAFRWQHLVGVPEIAYVRVDYGRKADSGVMVNGKYGGLLIINCVCREPRGIGA